MSAIAPMQAPADSRMAAPVKSAREHCRVGQNRKAHRRRMKVLLYVSTGFMQATDPDFRPDELKVYPCSLIEIELYGKTTANDCGNGLKPPPARWLDASQLQVMYGWLDKFAGLEMDFLKEGDTTLRLILSGKASMPLPR